MILRTVSVVISLVTVSGVFELTSSMSGVVFAGVANDDKVVCCCSGVDTFCGVEDDVGSAVNSPSAVAEVSKSPTGCVLRSRGCSYVSPLESASVVDSVVSPGIASNSPLVVVRSGCCEELDFFNASGTSYAVGVSVTSGVRVLGAGSPSILVVIVSASLVVCGKLRRNFGIHIPPSFSNNVTHQYSGGQS